jgi:AmmeMemoRadiSam system protein A
MDQAAKHAPVSLARQSILHYLTQGALLEPPSPLAPEMCRQAGAFVSLTKRGKLRGCIGTCLPTQPTLAQEILRNAVVAAVADPRFPPLTLDELDEVEIAVDVLAPPEKVTDTAQLDPRRYGVIVRAAERVGVLLPDIPQVTSVEAQLAIARLKAGIRPDEPVDIYRFEVTRYHEEPPP